MSDDDETTTDSGKAKGKEKKSKKKLVIILVPVVLGLGYKFGMGGGGAAADAELPEPIPGALVVMEPMSVNLANDHFLSVGVALQLAEGIEPKAFEEEGELAKTRDLIISQLGGGNFEALSTAEGREAAKHALEEAVLEIYHEDEALPQEVLGLYLTEFVMQ